MSYCCCTSNGQWTSIQSTPEGCHGAGNCHVVAADGAFPDCVARCAEALSACCIVGESGQMECQTATIQGDPWNLATCVAAGGEVRCPNSCADNPCNLPPPDETHPCCAPDGTCSVTDVQLCQAIGGEWWQSLESCEDVICEATQECRGPELPGDASNANDLRYSLDPCEVAVMQLTKRNPEHVVPGQPVDERQGTYMELVTTHEIRPVRVLPGAEPCRRSFGVLAKGLDGYVRPLLCSQPEHGDDQMRFNRGFFTKQMQTDIVDRVPKGYVHARVGVEQPVWSEVALYHNWFMSGIPI